MKDLESIAKRYREGFYSVEGVEAACDRPAARAESNDA